MSLAEFGERGLPKKTDPFPKKTKGSPKQTESPSKKGEGAPKKDGASPKKTKGSPTKGRGSPKETDDVSVPPHGPLARPQGSRERPSFPSSPLFLSLRLGERGTNPEEGSIYDPGYFVLDLRNSLKR